MKALVSVAAVVVIATCGYLVFDKMQERAKEEAIAQAAKERAEYLSCLNTLNRIKDFLKAKDAWDGTTLSEKIEVIESDPKYGSLDVLLLRNASSTCGPIGDTW